MAPPGETLAPVEGSENDMQNLILSCNKDGMELLKSGRTKDAFDNFKYAEAVLLAASNKQSDSRSLMAVTCNNLGCYYMKVRKFHGALSYLRRALKMEVELKTDETTMAGTHLNLCAILSKLEKPRKAVQHALQALDLMHRRVAGSENVASQDDYTTLAVCYHNIGQCRLMQVDEQTRETQQTDQAATAFQTGYQVALRFLGSSHPLTVTLEKNFQAVLHQAKNAKMKSFEKSQARSSSNKMEGTSSMLPDIAGASPGGQMGYATSVKTETATWAKGEMALWEQFAESTLRGSPPPQQVDEQTSAYQSEARAIEEPTLTKQLPPLTLAALAASDVQDEAFRLPAPQAFDMGSFRFQQMMSEQNPLLKKTDMGQALEDHPEALMDIIDAEGDGQKMVGNAPNDYRPNRAIKRSTRTSLVVRRTGVFNSTKNRDRVSAELAKKRAIANTPWKSAQTQTEAAKRIQRVWRAWFDYCQETSEWMTVTWICATMIQSHWRSYHVRRKKMDFLAGNIQRHCRGFLVRLTLEQHTAAVTIQKRAVGMITRRKLIHLHMAAIRIQRHGRGWLAHRRFREHKDLKVGVVTTIQKCIRVWLAEKRVTALREARNDARMQWTATIDLQRMFRGWKGRKRVEAQKAHMHKIRIQHDAAVRLQAMFRRRQAKLRVEAMRASRLEEMERAATFLRKIWLGARTRKRYRAILEEFRNAESQVITIQRYVRGFVCRVRLFNEAVAAEDELWAALQIQRRWRGYAGRVRAEDELERVWRQELGAAVIQRFARGWLARVRIGRAKRQMARAEFKRARARYQAAQKIQAVARGVLARVVVRARLARVGTAATRIQRVWRGTLVRTRLWRQLRSQRSIMIQSLVRGFLVRNRRFRLLERVLMIQRRYRKWLQLPQDRRERHLNKCKDRKRKAAMIQRRFRQFSQANEVRIIQDPNAHVRFMQRIGDERRDRMQRKLAGEGGDTQAS